MAEASAKDKGKEKDKDKEKGKTPEEGEAQAAPKAGGRKKLFLIAGAVIGLLVLIGVPVGIFAFKGKPEKKVEAALTSEASSQNEPAVTEEKEGEAAAAAEEGAEAETEEPLGALYPLDTFVVNLKGGRFLRLQAQVQFVEREVPSRIYPRLVYVRDGIIMLLAGRSAEDVLPPEGREALKKDIRNVINEILRKELVKDTIYFTQFVVQ